MRIKFLITSLLVIGSNAAAHAKYLHAQQDTVTRVTPPVSGFYSKYLNCEGIAIRSADVVDDKALYVAATKISRMLKYTPAVLKKLVADGAELHIIGKNQQTSDLPEFRDRKGVKFMDNGILQDIDQRTRGMGGIFASCGEENLLNLPGDRYGGGSDICTHEFAHIIMNYGLDSILRAKIGYRQKQAVTEGLWKDAYATSNPDEYWAELSMWYFGMHGEFLRGTKLPLPGPESLKQYDPKGYALLDSIYNGKLQPQASKGKASIIVKRGATSIPSSQNANLLVTNNSARDLLLFWVDFKGNTVLYKTIAAHTRYMQPTFMQHVWMVGEKDETALLFVKVKDDQCDIEIAK